MSESQDFDQDEYEQWCEENDLDPLDDYTLELYIISP